MEIKGRIFHGWKSGAAGNDNNPHKICRGGAPKTYERLNLNIGSGFILDQVSKASPNGGLTRKELCEALGWGDPKNQYTLLWSALLDDGLISCCNGRWVNTHRRRFSGYTPCRMIVSNTKEAPRYVITQLGQEILDKTYERVNRTTKL